MKAVVSPEVTAFWETDGAKDFNPRYPAVLFRNRVYVSTPRHLDAINLAFAGMTELGKYRVSCRIADGKEKLLFGSASGDGSNWEHGEEYQDARMTMYGFY